MARKRRSNSEQPIGVGLTAKQMRRKKPVNSDLLIDIEPLTEYYLKKNSNNISDVSLEVVKLLSITVLKLRSSL